MNDAVFEILLVAVMAAMLKEENFEIQADSPRPLNTTDPPGSYLVPTIQR